MLKHRVNIDKMPQEMQDSMLKLNQDLNLLAKKGNPLASFSYAKELYSALRSGELDQTNPEVQEECFHTCVEYFITAA